MTEHRHVWIPVPEPITLAAVQFDAIVSQLGYLHKVRCVCQCGAVEYR